jgi:outer membrane protein assembly factor BamB
MPISNNPPSVLDCGDLLPYFMQLIQRARPTVALALSAFLLCSTSLGSDWPNWRGPNSNGSVQTGNYPAKFDPAKPAWKVALPGKGTSTPIVHKDRVYLTCPADGEDALLAFDLSGNQLWQTKLGPEDPPKHRTLASSANASPATDNQAIYVYFKSGTLASLDFNGKIRWKTNLVESFGKDQLFWDQGTSPTLTDKHVVIARMHSGESWLAGFDKATGVLSWKEARNYKVPTENDNGYSTPLLFEQDGKKALLVWGADHLTAHSAADGKLLWECGDFNPEGTGYWPAIATPVIVGNMAVVPAGRDDRNQARIHGIKLGGRGDVTKTHRAWKRQDTGVFVATPAASNDRVYLLRHKGAIDCLDTQTGKTIWTGALPEHRSPYYSSPVIANGILYAAREDGTLFTARVQEKFELVGEHNLGERLIACPVPAADRLFIRGDTHLFCFATP